MVVGIITTAIRIGTIVYSFGSKYFPKTTSVLKQQGALEGAGLGAGLGSFVANVEYFYQEMGLIGLPETTQRNGNRFQKDTRFAIQIFSQTEAL